MVLDKGRSITCPLNQLPLLAWAWSVDLWDDAWPEEKKRRIVADSRRMHLLKTTLAGIKAHLAYVDAAILEVARPPARGFRVPAMSHEEWVTWLDQLPQIRIYPFLHRTLAPHRRFRVRYRFASVDFRGGGYRQASQGLELLGTRAVFVKDGKETPVQIEGLGDLSMQRILITHTSLRDYHGSRLSKVAFHSNGFRCKTDAAQHVITLQVNDQASDLLSVQRGLLPNDVRPVRIAQKHVALSSYSYRKASFRDHGFRQTSNAPLYLYDRFSIHEDKAISNGKTALWFRGHKRYGIDPFCAEFVLRVPMERPLARGFSRFRNGFRIPTDLSRLDAALNAITLSKALRDTIHVSTTTHRTVRLSDHLPLGSFSLGEIRSIF